MTFEVKTRWAVTPDCYLSVGQYERGKHIAISIWSESEGPFADLTVNLDKVKRFPRNYAFVDVNNFPEAEAMIKQLGIGTRIENEFGFSGYCAYPLYQFDEEAIKKWMEG